MVNSEGWRYFKARTIGALCAIFSESAQLAGLRPLDLLRNGGTEKVLAHAKIHAEENTW
jgi:hypothetical protein